MKNRGTRIMMIFITIAIIVTLAYVEYRNSKPLLVQANYDYPIFEQLVPGYNQTFIF